MSHIFLHTFVFIQTCKEVIGLVLNQDGNRNSKLSTTFIRLYRKVITSVSVYYKYISLSASLEVLYLGININA